MWLVVGAVGDEVVPVIDTMTSFDTLLRVAVSVALCLMGIPPIPPDPTKFPMPDGRLALMEKVVDVAPAGTVTAGDATNRSGLLLESEIMVPPAGAAVFRCAVHVPLAPGANS